MSVSLRKGQKVNLSKDNKGLTNIYIGLGWDAVTEDDVQPAEKKGLLSKIFGGDNTVERHEKMHDIDVDASCFLCIDGKLKKDGDVVYYGNLHHSSGAVNHTGDNLTGEGEGDDESILINLNRLPDKYDRLVIVANIYEAYDRNQDFGKVKNCYIRLVNETTKEELYNYNLSDNLKGMTALIFAEIYKKDGDWKFGAIGDGTKDGSIKKLAKRFE